MFEFTKKELSFLIFLLVLFLVGKGYLFYNVSLGSEPISIENKKKIDCFEQHLLAVQEQIKKRKINSNKNRKNSLVIDISKDSNSSLVIDINKASKEDFIKLPYIGPVRAQKIIEYRNSIGKFNKIEELINVKGIGIKTFSKLEMYLKIGN